MLSSQLVRLAVACAVCLLAAAVTSANVPPRTLSGTTLVVPAEHETLGRVYYVRYPSHTGQITFASDAPIEIIVGTSSRVVGYAVVEERDGMPTGRLLAGGFRLPVRSLDSGIPLRNEHMQQENFLDADNYPDITFAITGSDDLRQTSASDDSTTYAMTLRGEMMIRGVTNAIEIPAEVTLMPASDMTRNAGPGDVMALRCSYTIERSAFGVAPRFISPELLDTIELDQRLILTTVARDDRMARATNPEKEMQLQRMVSLIGDLRDLDAAVAHGRMILETYGDDAQALNTMAWNIATTQGTNPRRFPYLVEAAERAAALSSETDADVFDTVARVHYELGDLTKAIAWQRKAVDHREAASDPVGVVSTLNDYESQAGVPLTEVAGPVVEDLPQTPAMMRTYAGNYEVQEAGLKLSCLEKDGRLHLEAPGMGPMELLYQGDHKFCMAQRPQITLVFEVPEDRAVGLVLNQGSQVFEAVRTD